MLAVIRIQGGVLELIEIPCSNLTKSVMECLYFKYSYLVVKHNFGDLLQ